MFIFIFSGLFFGLSAFANPILVRISSADNFPSTDFFREGASLPKAGIGRDMVLTKKAYYSGDKDSCLKTSRKVGNQVKSISHWAAVLELKCALLDKPRLGDLDAVLSRIKRNPQWLLSSHFAKEIRGPFITALVQKTRLQTKSQRGKAWVSIDEAFSHRDWMNAEQEAELYALAGEMSFVEQNLLGAKDYFQKSLRAKEVAENRERLNSITLAIDRKKDAEVKVSELDFIKGRTASKGEQQIFERMTAAVNSKDLLSAVDDGVSLLLKYPRGDYAADVESQIAGLFIGLATGPEKNWEQIKSRVLRALKKVEGDRLLAWSKLSFSRGKYREAFELAETAATKLSGQVQSGEALSIAAQAAHSSGELKLAVKNYREIVEKFAGAPYYYESVFRMGLAHYRLGDYSDATGAFEKLLSSVGSDDYEYRALYWTWRSLQKLKQDRAQSIQSLLIQKYPMTFYGMRALAETSDQIIRLNQQPKKDTVRVTLRLLPEQKASWDRFGVLIRGGWLEEAQEELKNLPPAQSAEEHLIYSKLFAVAQGYVQAIQLMNKAWEMNPEFTYRKDFLMWIFPSAYQKEVASFSEKTGLHSVWIRSLIRQESAFNPRAVSRSNALGLMQLLPSTAQEVAQDLRKPPLKVPESLFESKTNVELGSVYLKRMLSRYDGQLPFALAAYNAGPTRLSRWLASSGVEVKDSELWMDELPWAETSYYVKAILRNILIFQILDQGHIKLSSPIWQISSEKL